MLLFFQKLLGLDAAAWPEVDSHPFDARDTLAFLILLLGIGGFSGWIYEVVFYWLNGGCKLWYWRGSTFIPWIDIYGLGIFLILLICVKIRKSPVKVFLLSGISCGILEYLVGLLMFTFGNGHRAWNYNTEILNFGNIQGFVCLRSVLVFAGAGTFFVMIVVPVMRTLYSRLSGSARKRLRIACFIFAAVLVLDLLYNDILVYVIPSLPSAGHL